MCFFPVGRLIFLVFLILFSSLSLARTVSEVRLTYAGKTFLIIKPKYPPSSPFSGGATNTVLQGVVLSAPEPEPSLEEPVPQEDDPSSSEEPQTSFYSLSSLVSKLTSFSWFSSFTQNTDQQNSDPEEDEEVVPASDSDLPAHITHLTQLVSQGPVTLTAGTDSPVGTHTFLLTGSTGGQWVIGSEGLDFTHWEALFSSQEGLNVAQVNGNQASTCPLKMFTSPTLVALLSQALQGTLNQSPVEAQVPLTELAIGQSFQISDELAMSITDGEDDALVVHFTVVEDGVSPSTPVAPFYLYPAPQGGNSEKAVYQKLKDIKDAIIKKSGSSFGKRHPDDDSFSP